MSNKNIVDEMKSQRVYKEYNKTHYNPSLVARVKKFFNRTEKKNAQPIPRGMEGCREGEQFYCEPAENIMINDISVGFGNRNAMMVKFKDLQSAILDGSLIQK